MNPAPNQASRRVVMYVLSTLLFIVSWTAVMIVLTRKNAEFRKAEEAHAARYIKDHRPDLGSTSALFRMMDE